MALTRLGIVGSGWRAEFFRRMAMLLPDAVELVGAATRRPEMTAARSDSWGVPVDLTPSQLLRRGRPDLVVTCVPWTANPGLVVELVEAGVKVLSETPPAPDLDGLRALWDAVGGRDAVQVAEQYHLMPGDAARAEIVRREVIGQPTQVQISSTHTYHAISLIRALLGVGLQPARVNASLLRSALVDPLSRDGWSGDTEPKQAETILATFDFRDGRSGSTTSPPTSGTTSCATDGS